MGKAKLRASRAKTKTKPAAPKPTPAASTEQLNDDQLQHLFFTHKRKIKELKARVEVATHALNEGYALAKAEGVAKKELNLALALETDAGEAKARADAERLARVTRWMGVEIGTQFDLVADTHREAGKRAALDDQPRRPPANLAQRDAQAWMDGFDAGRITLNDVRAQQFRAPAPLGDQPSTMTQ